MPFHLFNVDLGGAGQLKAAELVSDNIRKWRKEREDTERELGFSDTIMKGAHQSGDLTDEDYADYLTKGATQKHGMAIAYQAQQADKLKKQVALARLAQYTRMPQTVSPDPTILKTLADHNFLYVPGPRGGQVVNLNQKAGKEPAADSWQKLDRDARAISGNGIGAWNAAQNKRVEGDNFVGDLPGAPPVPGVSPEVNALLSKPKRLSIPVTQYRSLMQRYQALQGNDAEPVAPPPDAGDVAASHVSTAPMSRYITPPPVAAATPAATAAPADVSQHQAALEWATQHPKDPAAPAVRRKALQALGISMDGGGDIETPAEDSNPDDEEE
jgi:hypothetical protein